MARIVTAEQDTRSFLVGVQAATRLRLSDAGLTPTWQQRFSFVQASFGVRGIHYEAWLQRGRSQVEVGLHMEADAALNGWLLCRFGEIWPEVAHALGPGFELEQWTSSWGRIHSLFPYSAVDDDLVNLTGEQLARCIVTLEPLVADLLQRRRQR
jgi:hypothetical protein